VLFVTGMQRSGTTLLDRLLGNHPDASLLSQPFPLLFVEVKRAFLRRLGRTDLRYPLGHLFREAGYRPEDFARHLAELRLEHSHLEQIFNEMHDFPGQYTRFEPSVLKQVIAELPPPSDFAALLSGLYRALAPDPEARMVGGKETVCEEFLPYLLDRGCRCVLILRDPRDVVASLNHGRGQEYGGRIKPTLFNIRNWRKSVAFALHLEGRPEFQWLRYEDLVTDPPEVLQRIAQALGLEPFPADLPAGQAWTGNSSYGEHRGVSASSVGAYRKVLPSAVARFVEAACLPELRLLGYPTGMDTQEALDTLGTFREHYEITREGLEKDAATPANLAAEIRRHQLIAEEEARLAPGLPFKSAFGEDYLGRLFARSTSKSR
jgi:hypothetical protein